MILNRYYFTLLLGDVLGVKQRQREWREMIRRTIRVEKEFGTDIIPYLVQSACHYDCALRIESEEKNINMKSIMGMTILNFGKGCSFDLIADGADEQRAVHELAGCFE